VQDRTLPETFFVCLSAKEALESLLPVETFGAEYRRGRADFEPNHRFILCRRENFSRLVDLHSSRMN
jgi:hypothetical protein